MYGANKLIYRLISDMIIVYSIDFATFKILIILRSRAIMKYVNADIIFPEELLKEIQKYIHGRMVMSLTPRFTQEMGRKFGEQKIFDP